MEGREMKNINDMEFKTEVLDVKGLVLVDFWAEWCGPCRQLGPILEELSNDMAGKVKVVKMNVDEAPNTAAQFGIRSIPTMFLFKDGQKADTKIGLNSKQTLIDWVEGFL